MKTILITSLIFLISHFSFASEKISVEDARKLLNKENVIFLDVRTPKEWAKTGVIPGALKKNFYDDDFSEYIGSLDENKKYIVYCHSGGRSPKATKMMESAKLMVQDMDAGISGWLSEGFKTSK